MRRVGGDTVSAHKPTHRAARPCWAEACTNDTADSGGSRKVRCTMHLTHTMRRPMKSTVAQRRGTHVSQTGGGHTCGRSACESRDVFVYIRQCGAALANVPCGAAMMPDTHATQQMKITQEGVPAARRAFASHDPAAGPQLGRDFVPAVGIGRRLPLHKTAEKRL